MPVSTNNTGKGRRFTLVELIVSIGLFAFGFASIINVSNSLRQLNTFVDSTATASTLAEAKLEEMRAQEYAAVSSGSDTSEEYGRAWTVTEQASPPYKAVTVRVTWTDRRENEQQVELKTIVAE